MWNQLSYSLFRYASGAGTSIPVFSGDHGVYFGVDHPYNVQLKPDELLLELRDRSIDSGLRNRTHVLRYGVEPQPVTRINPVALQPQDFVDEWLTRPWLEMESRSSAANRDKLAQWHNFLSGPDGSFVGGDINVVQRCTEKPDDWKVSVTFHWIAGKELPEQFTVYFLVYGIGRYRFEMKAINIEAPDGCPGNSPRNSESPSLFREDPGKKGAMKVEPF
jgi:hypothetical protein